MNVRELKRLLGELEDTGELVLYGTRPDASMPDLLHAWRSACDESNSALDTWRRSCSCEAFAVYRAAADRADAAQDALAAAARRKRRLPRMPRPLSLLR